MADLHDGLLREPPGGGGGRPPVVWLWGLGCTCVRVKAVGVWSLGASFGLRAFLRLEVHGIGFSSAGPLRGPLLPKLGLVAD